MRPVSAEFVDTQQFGEGATAGVAPSWTPDTIGWYVRLYGNYQEYGHAGKDIGCPVGTPIHAPADGTVLYAGWTEDLPGTGNVRKWLLYYNFGGIITVIQHDGWISVIAHQSNNDHVSVGQQVREGQIIGLSGNTKTRTTTVAPHVHIEALVYLDYRTDVSNGIVYGRVDPTPYFGGIAAMGSITTPQEEPLVPNESDRVFWPIEGEGKVSLNELLNSLDRKDTAANQKLDLLLALVGESTTFTANDGSTVKVAEQFRSLDTKLDRVQSENIALRAVLEEVRSSADATPEVTAAIEKALSGLSFTITAGK